MTTELRPVTEKITQTRFFGGEERGTCLQITQTGLSVSATNPLGIGYIQLTRTEASQLATELLLFAAGLEEEIE